MNALQTIDVLDKGFVKLIAVHGSDEMVAAAARQSHNEDPHGRNNKGFLRRLLFDVHSGPFEHACVTLQIKAPIFVARQLVRHRTFKWAEYSLRYKEAEDFYIPDIVYEQSKDGNHQTSGAVHVKADLMRLIMKEQSEQALVVYRRLISHGVSREQARIILPVNFYTVWTWTGDIHNMLHMLALRMAPDAQTETRHYANAIANEFIKPHFPGIYSAFEEHRGPKSARLGASAMRAIAELVDPDQFYDMMIECGCTAHEASEINKKIRAWLPNSKEKLP